MQFYGNFKNACVDFVPEDGELFVEIYRFKMQNTLINWMQ